MERAKGGARVATGRAGVAGAGGGVAGAGGGIAGAGPGILSGPVDGPWRAGRTYREVEAVPGLVVTHLGSRFTGAVARFEHDGSMVLRSRNTGLERLFTLRPGSFSLAGETVSLVRPREASPSGLSPSGLSPSGLSESGPTGEGGRRAGANRSRTASGSLALPGARARVARASRLMVEGVHDAELVEKVWGDDLRAEGVVVERLDGIDVLEEVIRRYAPGMQAPGMQAPGRRAPDEGAGGGPAGVDKNDGEAVRLGVLVDHLVPGSKESRIAARLQNRWVRIAGTPYVDIWQAIKPAVVGIEAWPEVGRDRPWKEGICEHFGEASPGRLWKQLLGRVRSYADLEAPLVGAVESLIDFVTVGDGE